MDPQNSLARHPGTAGVVGPGWVSALLSAVLPRIAVTGLQLSSDSSPSVRVDAFSSLALYKGASGFAEPRVRGLQPAGDGCVGDFLVGPDRGVEGGEGEVVLLVRGPRLCTALFEIPEACGLRLQLARDLLRRSRVVDPAQEVLQRGPQRVGDPDGVSERDPDLVVLDGRDLAARRSCHLSELGLGESALLPPRADAVSGDVRSDLTFLYHGNSMLLIEADSLSASRQDHLATRGRKERPLSPVWGTRHRLRWTTRQRIRSPVFRGRSLSKWFRARSSARGRWCRMIPLLVDGPSTPNLSRFVAVHPRLAKSTGACATASASLPIRLELDASLEHQAPSLGSEVGVPTVQLARRWCGLRVSRRGGCCVRELGSSRVGCEGAPEA